MENYKVYQAMASLMSVIERCRKSGDYDTVRLEEYTARLTELVRAYMPRGSGVDHGTTIDIDRSNRNKLVLSCDWHHMDENGYYDGWTEHSITVTPSLEYGGFELRISGQNRNAIKDYLAELYRHALSEPGPNRS